MKVGRIAEELRLDRKTARKYLHAASAEELVRGARAARRTVLDEHAEFLARRWSEGCDSGEKLHQELVERGVAVSKRTVRRFLVRMRADAAPNTKPPTPKVAEVATLVLTHPSRLTDENQALARELRERRPELDHVARLAESFAIMLINRTGGSDLSAWVDAAEASNIRELVSFAGGLRKDWDAVLAGLSLSALELRSSRRPREPHQDAQAPDVRQGAARPAP